MNTRRVFLPLEGRVAAKRPGGVGSAGRDAPVAPSASATTPSGPSGHLPLKGGERTEQ
jgi:hypothetical protein